MKVEIDVEKVGIFLAGMFVMSCAQSGRQRKRRQKRRRLPVKP